MKVLWLCNMRPSRIQEDINGQSDSGLWVDNVLEGLLQNESLSLFAFCLYTKNCSGQISDRCGYETFAEGSPYIYMTELETRFREKVAEYGPDVVHIWGTEYAHTLAMVNACEQLGILDKVVISIQGLCSVIAKHYVEGLPFHTINAITFRDVIRQDNIRQQQQKFARRGEFEVKALEKVHHIMGRTRWDEACTARINPMAKYHACNETLRASFYEKEWHHETCKKHRIFASSCFYPVKGFHYLLEAFADVLKVYPDATLAVAGSSFFTNSIEAAIRKSSYPKYLAKLTEKYGLRDRIEFLGGLSAEEMGDAYLDANVFVLPSTSENSPNSLGEAMLLGVPCVASDVGGVTTMMEHNKEGFVYQSTAPYMLAYYIMKVFSMEKEAEILGTAARRHAQNTHDPDSNLNCLMEIYQEISENG